jgi:leader peptidase (prepilin peptidase)/N-methyltransferase
VSWASVLELIVAGVVGLLVGSFLGTLVLRLPKGLPVVRGRSACPYCGRALGPLELIPIASWLIQRRRCCGCGARLSAFYPAMEIASALVALAAIYWTPWPAAIAACVLGWIALVLGAWALRGVVGAREI